MKTLYLILAIIIFFFLQQSECNAEPPVFSGQAAAFIATGNPGQAELIYLPEMQIHSPLSAGSSLDTDVILNINSHSQNGTAAKLYRGWARYSTSHLEMRAGLQKINFGPARLLRTLMWFDRIDPRDPLQFTDGVNAMLLRYTWQNNSNLWAWGLAGNNNLKGLELYLTDTSKMEYGGRYQFPVPRGEFAFSCNQRYIDKNDWASKMLIPMTDGKESRYAIDGSWDLGIGFWCEGSLGKIQVNNSTALYEKLYTLGSDYTLPIGPGVHVLGEHFVRSQGFSMDQQVTTNILSAAQVDFQLNMLDRIYAIAYFDWQAQKLYPYLRYQRSYDRWQINLLAYSVGNSATISSGAFQGSGLGCMVIYNY